MNNVNTKIQDIYNKGINDGSVMTYNEIMEFLNSFTEQHSRSRIPANMTVGDISFLIAKNMHENFSEQAPV